MNYPFSAIVGQEKLKKALLICAINPAIGGLLIRGDKGTAKSTAARALAEIVPPITKIANCLFNCTEHTPLSICEVCAKEEKEIQQAQVPFINLPLGATEERVLGSLDLEGVLIDKKKKLQPGLLASAHQGILYIDEVNLLADHLVDVLLDVSAMGVNTIEREGLSISHPARFTLIGTMNPEEGTLRPQFLDRFGLMVSVEAPKDVAERTEVVRRRIAFETGPATFISRWEAIQQELQQKLILAKNLLPDVQLSDELLTLISELCSGMGVKSLRADIVMYKTALTLAALDARKDVSAEDVREAAELVLAHRSQNKPFSEPDFDKDKLDEMMNNSSSSEKKSETNQKERDQFPEENFEEDSQEETDSEESENSPNVEQIFAAALPKHSVKLEVKLDKIAAEQNAGKRTKVSNTKRGQLVGAQLAGTSSDIAIDATIYHALNRDPENFEITRADVHQKIRTGKTGNLILFVVDASGSMAASRRMEAVKGTVLSLLTDAYQRRDAVSVIAFRGIGANILLQPTQSIELAEQALSKLPTGGRTPLPHALQSAIKLVSGLNPQKDLQPLLVILSDGKANVALSGGDPWKDTINLAAQLKNMKIPSLVINADIDFLQLGRAEALAECLGGEYISMEQISTENLIPVINKVL